MDLITTRGLPLSFVNGPELQEFVDAVRRCSSYKVPARTTVSGPLLDATVERIKQDLATFDMRTNKTGCTITSDGWSDAAGNPLVNVLQVNPKGAKFLYAINTTGNRKCAPYICDIMAKAVEMIGADKVVAVVTDSAEEAAGLLLEAQCVGWSRARAARRAVADA
jgi:hypothetical protein